MSGTSGSVQDAVHTVHVRGLSSEGAGVAELEDGRVVFVPRTAPGDVAEVRLTKSKKRWARADLVRLVEPAQDRVEPACPLYARCGGCALQHLPYEAQLHWKARSVSDALARIGGFEVEPPEIVGSPAQLRYRNRITYTLRRLPGGRVVAGFHALDKPAHVIDVGRQCLLPEEPLTAVWVALRGAWGTGARHLPDGGRLRLTLRLDPSGVALVVEGGEGGWSARELIEAMLGQDDDQGEGLAAVWHRPTGRKVALRVYSRGAESGESPVGADEAPAFRQVNSAAADELRAHVLERSGTPEQAVDAYCGTGVYARALAATGTHVVGIELDPGAADAARDGAPETLEILEGSVEALLAQALPADLLIVNPPRTGLEDGVPDVILATPPSRLVYVSCDAATLARDLQRLGDAYRLVDLRAFDLFPQTAAVEAVAVLEHTAEEVT